MVFERLPDGSWLSTTASRARVERPFRAETGAHSRRGERSTTFSGFGPSSSSSRDLAYGETSHLTARLSDDVVWEFSCSRCPRSRAAAVGVLRDITRLERTETMRRTFVADVSHELRTPISSIAAAAETSGRSPDGAGRRSSLV